MAWPTDNITKSSLDDGADDPSQARSELVTLIDTVKAMIAGAVSAATAACVVLRDASGDFAARYITATKFIGSVAKTNGAVVLDTTGADAVYTGLWTGYAQAFSTAGAIVTKTAATVYTNTTGKALLVSINISPPGGLPSATLTAYAGATPVATATTTNSDGNWAHTGQMIFVVPAGSEYHVAWSGNTGAISCWSEFY